LTPALRRYDGVVEVVPIANDSVIPHRPLSGCSSGANVAHQDNLRLDMYESFVSYLATVVRHFRDAEGISFESLEPFNEPDGGWTARGRQEANGASYSSQNALIPMLASRLKRDGLDPFVSGVDMNNLDAAVGGLRPLSTEPQEIRTPTFRREALNSLRKVTSSIGCRDAP
jgi:O-Glycosyl hydrolase family 30